MGGVLACMITEYLSTLWHAAGKCAYVEMCGDGKTILADFGLLRSITDGSNQYNVLGTGTATYRSVIGRTASITTV